MDLGTKKDTVRERAERRERGKEKAKAKERKASRTEERKVRERATAGKDREIGGTSIMIRGGQNRSVVTVVTVGHGVTRRPSALSGRSVVRWNTVQWCHVLHRLLFLTLDPLCRNVSKQCILLLSHLSVGRNLLTIRWTGLTNGGTIGKVIGWRDWQDDWYWHDSEDCASEPYDNENAYLLCGVAGSSPSLNQQSKDKVKLMIDSGSQSTACSVDFAKGKVTDDTERATLWDIQDQKIEAHGKKIVDVKFHGQANETLVPASINVDVSDVARNVASMGRLLRAGFDLHFTNHGHTCWIENGVLKTTISEDSPTSEAPLYSLDVEVLPPPGEICESRSTASARIASIAMDDERVEEGSRVELAGLVRDVGLNGKRGICMGRAPDGERWLIALPGGRRVNAKTSNIKPAGDLDTEIVQREDTSAVPLRGPEDPPSRAMIEAHNLTHLPAAPWCEICVQARGRSDYWHTQVKYDNQIPCVQMDFQFISGVAVWCPEAQAKATVLTMVDMDSGYVGVLMVSGKNTDNFTLRSSSSFVD